MLFLKDLEKDQRKTFKFQINSKKLKMVYFQMQFKNSKKGIFSNKSKLKI